MLKDLITNTFIQWLIFLTIPSLIYLIFFRREFNYFEYLGLKKHKKVNFRLLVKVTIISLIYGIIGVYIARQYNIIDTRYLSAYKEKGLFFLTLIIFIQQVIRTGFLEEMIFRAFIINTLKNKISFKLANHIQAIIFTALHYIAVTALPLLFQLLAIVPIYLLSIYFGKLFKESEYSVFYSSIFHSSLNVFSAILSLMIVR